MGKLWIRAACLLSALTMLLTAGCFFRDGDGCCCCGRFFKRRNPPAVPANNASDTAFVPQSSPYASTAAPYGGQRTCPVSGVALGVSGPAVPVTVRGQTIYVCCQNCAAKVRSNPDVYLAKVLHERQANTAYTQQQTPGNPTALSPAATAQAPYGGQKTCPVSGVALGVSGPAVPVTVRGQTIYVCCQNCAAKVRSNPDVYLAKALHERQGSAAVPQPPGNYPPAYATAATSQTPYGGQKTCPVSGVKLGVSGPAVPVTVRGQTIYVCCQNCAAKVRSNPDAYLAKALQERQGGAATAPQSPATTPVSSSAPYGGQKTCPVTGEVLGEMGPPIAVNVQGQTIYVCCKGCARKVRQNPAPYLAKVLKERQGN